MTISGDKLQVFQQGCGAGLKAGWVERPTLQQAGSSVSANPANAPNPRLDHALAWCHRRKLKRDIASEIDGLVGKLRESCRAA